MKKIYLRLIPMIVLLILGPLNYIHNQYAYPSNLPEKSSSYTGRCIEIETETIYSGKHSLDFYMLTMEDGRKFWISNVLAMEGDFDFPDFYRRALDHSISLRYIDVNLNATFLAKEVVEVRIGSEILLPIDVAEQNFQKARIVFWGLYIVFFLFFGWLLFSAIQDEREQRKLTAHRQQTKAQRRAWLDAHPEEKGAPPSARRKKDRR